MMQFRELWAFFYVSILNPGQNKQATILIYAIIGLLVALLIVVGALYALGGDDEDDEDDADAKPKNKARQTRQTSEHKRREMLLGIAGSVLLFFAVWVAAGYSTSKPDVCTACHFPLSQHSRKVGVDPHAKTDCVACHEPGGVVGRYFSDVPLRAVHFYLGQVQSSQADVYGRVESSACSACHRDSLKATTLNASRALRMSHAEPMADSASCLDCHQIRNGIVGMYNAGMKQCLRCHDGDVASTDCVSCHTEKASASARVRSTAFRAAQVKEVDCGGCHEQKKECDPCHGIRMPHTEEFVAGAHARAAAVNFWYQDGKVCVKCHTQTRRPCSCHTAIMGKAHGQAGATMPAGHKKSKSQTCDACHGVWAPTARRDFCTDVCHTKAAIKYSPR